MSLQRYTRSVDGSIPVPALLYDDEELLASQDGVGIYDGLQKSPDRQNGTVHITSHRLFYIDSARAHSRSFALDLSLVARTDYYAGLFTSSPKVTLHLTPAHSPTPPSSSDDDPAGDSWLCEVCNYRNPPGASPATARCALCGVPRSKSSSSGASPSPSPFAPHLSASLPPSPPPEPGPASDETACPACTFLNHPALPACEMCGTALPRTARASKSAPASRPASPPADGSSDPKLIKLSFRRGGDKAFYAAVKRSLQAKAWETTDARARPAERAGIDGLLRTAATAAAARSTDLDAALQDLDALMAQARGMVRLAHELHARAAGAGADAEPEAAAFVRTSLAQLGLQLPRAPVTRDMVRDDARWLAELAAELAALLQGPAGLMRARGIVALDEVWGAWNRARGVALIPPATFLRVLPHLPAHTAPPLAARTFGSGLRVLHAPAHGAGAFAARVGALLPRTARGVARAERVAPALAGEMLREAEAAGVVCRDEGGEGEVVWWVNVFVGYVWDGQE